MAVTLSVTITQVSQNIAANTSQVRITVKATATGGSYNNYSSGSYAPTGTVRYGGNLSGSNSYTHSFAKNSTTTIYETTKTVTHNADGTAKVTASANLVTHVSAGTISASASKTLTTIPRASTPSVSGTTQLGSAITINTNRKSSSFTHTLTWKWAGETGTIATKTDDASVSWTPDIATFAPYLTDGTSADCTITCTTYSGSTAIGSKTCTFKLSIPASVVPSISTATISDAAGLLAKFGAYVQNMSDIQASVTAAGVYGSTIKEYRASVDGLAASGTSSTLDIGAPPTAGTRTVTVTVTDTRGRTASKDVQITVATYGAPVLDASAYRVNASTGSEDDESTTIRVAVSGSVHNVNNKGVNTGTVKIEWKLKTSETWTSASDAARGQTFSFNLDLTGKANTDRFDIRVTVTDSLGSSAQIELAIGTAQPVMDFKNGGDGVAVLGIADRAGFRVGAASSFGGALGFEDEDGATQDFMRPQANGRPTIVNHIGLANGTWLQAALASGAFSNILRMNENGEVELNWTQGGMRGRVWKTLWSGTLSSGGSVTVSEIGYYRLIGAAMSFSTSDTGGEIIVPCVLRPAESAYFGITANYASGTRLYICELGVSGTTVKNNNATMGFLNSGESVTGKKVYAIYGIL